MWVWLIDVFNWHWTPWIFAGIFVAAAFVAGCLWSRHARKLKTDLKVLGRCCQFDRLAGLSDDEKRSEFARFKSDIEDAIELWPSRPPIGSDVLSFVKECEIQQFGNREWATAYAPPEESLNLSRHLQLLGVNVSLYRALPGYLVGLGLCVTFLGLAVVIGNASQVLDSVDANNTSESLRNLLTAASSKFWASLAAVFCSIGYSIRFRSVLHQMERGFAQFSHELRHCTKLVDIVEVQYKALTKLTATEEHLTTVAQGISNLQTGFDSRGEAAAKGHHETIAKFELLADNLEKVVLSVEGGFAAMGESIGRVNDDAFSKIATEMAKSLNKGIQEHLQNMTQQLEASSNIFKELPSAFDALVTKIRTETEKISAAFENSTTPLETALAKVLRHVQEVAKEFSVLPSVLAPAQTVAESMAATAQVLETSAGKFDGQNQALVKRWTELSGLVNKIDSSLGESVKSVQTVFSDYAEKLSSFSETWEKSMVDAIRGISARIQEINLSHEDIRSDREVWREAAHTVSKGLDELRSTGVQLMDRVARSYQEHQDLPHSDDGAPEPANANSFQQ